MSSKTVEWLNAGGAEVIFEMIRRIGWAVEVVDENDWVYAPESGKVSIASQERRTVSVCSTFEPYMQAQAVVATVVCDFARVLRFRNHGGYRYPVFHVGEHLDPFDRLELDRFLEAARLASEATMSLAVAR